VFHISYCGYVLSSELWKSGERNTEIFGRNCLALASSTVPRDWQKQEPGDTREYVDLYCEETLRSRFLVKSRIANLGITRNAL
jgi:hypothetical protein